MFIGTDIVEVNRIRKILNEKGDRFLAHIYSAEEVDYCSERIHPHLHYAGRFSAKEAIKKANPILLEPIMKVEVSTPDEYQGELMGDLYKQGREIAMYLPAEPDGYIANAPFVWGPQPYKGHIFFSDWNTGLWAVKLQERTEPSRIIGEPQ